MNLYIINTDITFDQAQFLLKNLVPFNGEACDVIKVKDSNVQNIKSGYIDILTIGKFKHQLINQDINHYIKHDEFEIIYYLVQTRQINFEKTINYIYNICDQDAYKCLKLLFELGISIDDLQKCLISPYSPLQRVCLRNSVKCLKVLISLKINLQTLNATSPLHCACFNNRVKIIELLLLNKVNINIQDSDGDTPLHLAYSNKCYESIELLLSHNAKTDIVNRKGLKPIELSSNNFYDGHLEIM